MNIFQQLIGTTWAELALPVVPVGAKLSSEFKGKLDLGKAPGMPWAGGGWGPIKWKAWRAKDGDATERLTRWSRWLPTPNLGLRCGELVALDVDCEDGALVGRLTDIAWAQLGVPLVRYRDNSPRTLLLYRSDIPMPKQVLAWEGGKVEILGQGQQFVAWGTHPSGAELKWANDNWPVTPVYDLVTLTPEGLAEAMAALRAVLTAEGLTLIQRASKGHLGDHPVRDDAQAPELLVTAAVEALPCNEATAPDREAWVKIVGAIYAASAGNGWGQVLAQAWADRWAGFAANGVWQVDDTRWHSFANGTGWGARQLFDLATRHGWQGGDELAAWTAEQIAQDFDPQPAGQDLFGGINATTMQASENALWSDQAIARRVADRLGDRVLFCSTAPHGGWMLYDSGRWQYAYKAADRVIADALIKMASQLGDDGKQLKNRLQSKKQHDATVGLMKGLLDVGTLGVFDLDPWLLNTPVGVVDLRTGQLLPHDAKQLMMRQTSVAPSAERGCPQWLAFLDQMTGHDAALVLWLQKALGATICGVLLDAALMFLFGAGRNGKTTLLRVVASILGSYWVGLPMRALIDAKHAAHPEALARLAGARFVTASEIPSGARWDTAALKTLTGNDPLTVRHLYAGSFEFLPTHTLWIGANHRPQIDHVDQALASRINLIELKRTFLQAGEESLVAAADTAPADPMLFDKLVAEGPGILAWMIEGCLRWQRDGGLSPKPDAVVSATRRYLDESDVFMRWLHERTVRGPGESMRKLKEDFAAYLHEVGDTMTVVNDTSFGRMFRKHLGADAVVKAESGMVARGIRLKDRDLFAENSA